MSLCRQFDSRFSATYHTMILLTLFHAHVPFEMCLDARTKKVGVFLSSDLFVGAGILFHIILKIQLHEFSILQAQMLDILD